MKKNPTPKNGESKASRPVVSRGPIASSERTEARHRRIAAALRVPYDSSASAFEADALYVAAFAADVLQISRMVPAMQDVFAKTLSGMADLARGAREPGKTFNSEISNLVTMVDFIVADEDRDPAMGFLVWAEGGGFAAKLLEGLDSAAARTLVLETFALLKSRKLRAPVGVVVNLLHAAAQRGVKFDGGANVGTASSRTQIAHLVDGALSRAPF